MLAGKKLCSDLAASEHWKIREQGLEFSQDPAICPRPEDQQEEPVGRVVPALEINASSHRLHVPQTHLELDGSSAPAAVQHRVPGPLVGPAGRTR